MEHPTLTRRASRSMHLPVAHNHINQIICRGVWLAHVDVCIENLVLAANSRRYIAIKLLLRLI